MRVGGSKAKGGAFENYILKKLREIEPSTWKTLGSGNTADDKGDLAFKNYIIECKHHKTLNESQLNSFWDKIVKEAEHMKKLPLLIYKENYRPIKVVEWDPNYLIKATYDWDDWYAVKKDLEENKNGII